MEGSDSVAASPPIWLQAGDESTAVPSPPICPWNPPSPSSLFRFLPVSPAPPCRGCYSETYVDETPGRNEPEKDGLPGYGPTLLRSNGLRFRHPLTIVEEFQLLYFPAVFDL